MNSETVLELAEMQSDWMKQIRRALHEIPEKSGEEFKTQAYIMEKLAELNISHAPMLTGVVGWIEGARSGETIALRADIDALPVNEPEGNPFRSRHEGWMHACGHDAHAAILLGAARILFETRSEWAGVVKLIFQPAEECTEGARGMVRLGVMENVDRVYGLHVMPHVPAGTIEIKPGTINASADAVNIDVIGSGCHGAYPERGADAIVCAAQMITALQTLISRNTPPTQAAVLSIGMIEGGTARNIICDRVMLRGTLRTVNSALRDMLMKRIRETVAGIARAMCCEAAVEISDYNPAVINDAKEARRVLELAGRMLGENHAVERDSPSMGAEDFSEYLSCAPGAFYHIGCANPDDVIPAAALHSREFRVDERCLAAGAAMQAGLVLCVT